MLLEYSEYTCTLHQNIAILYSYHGTRVLYLAIVLVLEYYSTYVHVLEYQVQSVQSRGNVYKKPVWFISTFIPCTSTGTGVPYSLN